MPALRYEVVDVFADRPFAGNPLAVVLDADGLPDAALGLLAREFNLSETAFPLRTATPGADYRLRILTPAVELPFAGHPSVGAAWVLARLGRVAPGRVVQECGAGLLPLAVAPDGGPVELTAGTPVVRRELDPAPLLAATGLTAADAAGSVPLLCSTGLPQAFLEVRPDALARVAPDHGALAGLAFDTLSAFAWDADRRTARTRVFGTGVGVGEDPATGSAATAFGAWLAASGRVPGDGETAYVVEQGVEMGRPSRLECAVVTRGGAAVECRVAGRVVPVARGEIAVP